MKQYQVVIVKLQNKARDDEESLTDLLNERSRSGWAYESAVALSPSRIMLIFGREA